MVKKWLVFVLLLVVSTASDTSYFYYTPLLMERAEFETSIQLNAMAKPISQPGKLCLYKNWVLLVENYKGIHLIDNSDPANPVNKGFLTIPGCLEVAVRNDVFYVNSSVDLVGVKVDFAALTAIEMTRQRGILPFPATPDGYIPEYIMEKCASGEYVLVGWLRVNGSGLINTPYYE